MKKIILSVSLFLTPLFALATADVEEIIGEFKEIFDLIVPLLMVVAMAAFLWGIVKYIMAAGDEEKRKDAKGTIIYGVLGMFILVAFWGIIQIVAWTFGNIELGGTITPPKISP